MNNSYLSEAEVRLPGIQLAKSLAKLLRSKGYLESTAPIEVPKSRYEFYPYRVVVYHPVVEDEVCKFLDRKITFKILHE